MKTSLDQPVSSINRITSDHQEGLKRLGILILMWPRPIFPLLVALMILSSQLYINFSMHLYTATNMLLFILILITLALTIYHSRPQFR